MMDSRMEKVVGAGVLIGVSDKHGNPIHIGDTLAFDEHEWGGQVEPYVVKIENGQIQLLGCPADLPRFCEVVKQWDTPEDA